MKPEKLLTTIAIIGFVLIAGCKKDDNVKTLSVISSDPVNLTKDIPLNKIITVTFNEDINPVTITLTSFTLETATKGVSLVTGVVSCTGAIASFTPSSDLLPGTTYTGTVKATVKDLYDNVLQSNCIWTFTTSAIPIVTSTDPLNLATNVALNKVISANFSMAMDSLTITSSTFTLMDGVTPVSGTVNYSNTTATFTPGSALILGKTYTATITAGAKNVPGIALANKYVWTFSTGSVISPTVISTDPLNLATNTALNKVIKVDFSALMDPLTITTSTFVLMNGATPVSGAVNYSGTTASFTPGSALLAGKTYTATITTGAKNVPGTPLASDYVWTFSTIPQTFTLAITAINGIVIKNPDHLTYDYDTLVQLNAIPDLGYDFVSWSGDIISTANPLTVTMNANKNITANFALTPVSVCPTIVDLGTSGNYVILSESGISTTGVTLVTGNMGINPAAATFLTGFGLILPAGGAYSTSSLVVGKIYAPGYAAPTPANLVTATGDMHTAYSTANGLVVPAPTNEYMAGNLNGQTLSAGIYKWSSNVGVTNGIILDGGGDNCATFIFQIAGDLTVANSAIITLQNGAQAKNIFWVVAGSKAALGTDVDFSGNILCKTLISLNTRAKVKGRLLAQTAVTLNAATVVKP